MERYLTVKEIADYLEVSKPTVQRIINSNMIKANKQERQTRYYNMEAAMLIAAKIKPDLDFSACVRCVETPPNEPEQTEKPAQNTAKRTETLPNEPEQTEKPAQEENIELLKLMITTIQEQLNAKDKQIAEYQKQIANQNEQIKAYTERLKEALELTKGQQYITAADKTANLIEATEKQKDEEIINTDINLEIKQKGLIKRFFNRFHKNK